MSARQMRPVSNRRTEFAGAADVQRRLMFVFVLLGAAAGAGVLLSGVAQHVLARAIVGGSVLALAALLWKFCKPNMRATVDEIRRNPFKPDRVSKESDDERE